MTQRWSELGRYQETFSESFAYLLAFAMEQNIPVRIKDGFRDSRVHGVWGEKKGYGAAYSCHKVGLAVDLWTSNSDHHVMLHDFWDKVGGAKRIAGDMGHYSFEWMGYR